MPTAAPAGFTLGAIRPADAIAAFQQRKLLKPSFRWEDVWHEEHAVGFASAGVMRLDILTLLRDQVDGAVTNGSTMAEFRDTVRDQLFKRGFWGDIDITDPATGEQRTTRFDDNRLKLIFDVNMRQSHAAGRWARIQRGTLPFIVYRTMQDGRVRPEHQAWNNVVLHKDDPWWDTHFPPCGWRCRCTAFAVDEAGIDALRKAAPKDSPVKLKAPPIEWVEFENRSTGQVTRVPRGIDPGFAYNPGKVHVQKSMQLLERGLNAVRPTAPNAAPGANDAQQLTKAVVAQQRREPAFGDFLRNPPPVTPGRDVGLPVAAVPAVDGAPHIASVSAAALRKQAAAVASSGDYPRTLPTTAAGWALSQAIIDMGQRLVLGDGRVLWWWLRGTGASQRVLVLELKPSPLVWWVQQLATLSVDEARAQYPKLKELLNG